MHPQLERIAEEFRAARARLHRLRESVAEDRWGERADPERWSVAECVAHLNLTSQAYESLVPPALEQARKRKGAARVPTRYRRDLTGWMLWKMMPPPVRLRTRTVAAFLPERVASVADLVAEFDRLQGKQLDWVRQADGLPLTAVRITSPFNARMRYNLFACLSILPPHQHRHLWQAERVWGD